VGVVDEGLLSIFFYLSFLQFYLLLFLNLVHVVFSLDSSLLSQSRGFFLELPLSGLLEIGLDPLSLGLFQLFSFSGTSLALFESSLCSECINFGLSISCFLLKLSESLDLTLFLLP